MTSVGFDIGEAPEHTLARYRIQMVWYYNVWWYAIDTKYIPLDIIPMLNE
jgi:hypothetical protein